MTITHEFENDISKIDVPDFVKLDDATLKANQELMKGTNACINFGPLSICYTIDLPKITVTVSVFGIEIGKFVLDPTNPCQRITINMVLVSGFVELCIQGSCLILNAQVCKFGSCTNWKNVQVFCWG